MTPRSASTFISDHLRIAMRINSKPTHDYAPKSTVTTVHALSLLL